MTQWDDNAIRDSLQDSYLPYVPGTVIRSMRMFSDMLRRYTLRELGGQHAARSVRRWRRGAWGRSRRIHAGPR